MKKIMRPKHKSVRNGVRTLEILFYNKEQESNSYHIVLGIFRRIQLSFDNYVWR
jgi:hypothetical protein